MNTHKPGENDEARLRNEARVLAVLLGEADPVEAAAVDELLRADAGLRAYRDALLEALPLLREAGRLTQAAPDLRMDESRRAALLEQLRTPSRRKGNVIPWSRWLRQNWGALAACGTLLVGGATGIFVLDQREGITLSSAPAAREEDFFAVGTGGGSSVPVREIMLRGAHLPGPSESAGAGETMVSLQVELPPVLLNGTPPPMTSWATDKEVEKISSAQMRPAQAPATTMPAPSFAPSAPRSSVSALEAGQRVADDFRRDESELKKQASAASSMARQAAPERRASAEKAENSATLLGGHFTQPVGRSSALDSVEADVARNAETFAVSGASRPAKVPLPEEISEQKFKKKDSVFAPVRAEVATVENPFSTFSLNVSDASFQFAWAALQRRQWPAAATLRAEEFVNALRYGDAPPLPGEAVALTQEQAHDPFLHGRTMLRLSVQTASAGRNAAQPLNLTVLLDTSGSMERADRQEILSSALASLAAQLQPRDTVSVLGFARTPRLLLARARGEKAAQALTEIAGSIPPEGGTNLSAALTAAYEQNHRTRTETSLNRIVLLTDGAANLGDADPAQLEALVKSRLGENVTLDCFGVGFDDYNDVVLEALARASHGRYAFLSSAAEAREDFARVLAGALQVAAKNVKVQVEFNPERVAAHHLFGYEKHQLRTEDFRDNTVRAAEIGAAESGTALYRVALRPDGRGEIGMVRVRYQDPRTGAFSERRWVIPFAADTPLFDQSAPGVQWAATAAYFAEKLRGGTGSEVIRIATLCDIARRLGAAGAVPEENKKLHRMLEQARLLE